MEVQIRTKEMHEIAEYGIAAHWAYKEGKTVNPNKESIDQKLTWFSEILEFQNESSNAEEFMESLKLDLFSDMVYVFTPKGEVIELPQDRFQSILLIACTLKSEIVQSVQK